MIVAYIISAVCLLVDQLTKFLLYGKSCSLIGDLLWLEPGFNTGASFSMFSNATIFLIIFSIPMVVLINYAIISNKLTKSKFLKIALGILLGGTVGNLIDRIVYGGVRDFIYLKSINFAIFNFADVFINIGVYLLIGYIIYMFAKEYKKQYKQAKEEVKPKVDKQMQIHEQIIDGKESENEKADEAKSQEDNQEKTSYTVNGIEKSESKEEVISEALQNDVTTNKKAIKPQKCKKRKEEK